MIENVRNCILSDSRAVNARAVEVLEVCHLGYCDRSADYVIDSLT